MYEFSAYPPFRDSPRFSAMKRFPHNAQFFASTLCMACFSVVVLAGCASITHSMDTKEEGHAGMEHSGMDHSGMEHSSAATEHKMKEGHGHGSMNHGTLMIPEDQPQPSISLTVEPDAMRGWNLNAAVRNFAFAPEQVNQSSTTTEGHAHLYINGEKITRLYGSWYYIPELPAGEHEIRVELNANGHEILMSEGEAIADTATVTVPAN